MFCVIFKNFVTLKICARDVWGFPNYIATMSLYRSVTISFVYRTISRQSLLEGSNFKAVHNVKVFLTRVLIFPIFLPYWLCKFHSLYILFIIYLNFIFTFIFHLFTIILLMKHLSSNVYATILCLYKIRNDHFVLRYHAVAIWFCRDIVRPPNDFATYSSCCCIVCVATSFCCDIVRLPCRGTLREVLWLAQIKGVIFVGFRKGSFFISDLCKY